MHPAAISGIWSSPNSLKVRSRMSFQPREGIWPGRSALRPRPGWSASTRLTGEVLPSPTPSTARCPDRGRPRRGTRVADHLGGRKARVKAHRGVAWPVARRLWDRSGVSRCMPLIKLEISSPTLRSGLPQSGTRCAVLGRLLAGGQPIAAVLAKTQRLLDRSVGRVAANTRTFVGR